MWRKEFGLAKFIAGVVTGVGSTAVVAVLVSVFSSESFLAKVIGALGGVTASESADRVSAAESGVSLRYPYYEFGHYSGFSQNECKKHLFKTLDAWPYKYTAMPGNLIDESADGANIYLPESNRDTDLILSFRCYTFSLSEVPGDDFSLVFVTSASLGRSEKDYDVSTIFDEFFEDFNSDLPSGVSKNIRRFVKDFKDEKVVIDDRYLSYPITTSQTIDFFWINIPSLEERFGLRSPPSIIEMRDLLIQPN